MRQDDDQLSGAHPNSGPTRGGRQGWRERWQRRWPVAVMMVGLFALSWLPGTGLVSSNDGSHLALARALALRHESRIDPDRDLCLRVDVARRAGHAYSDRPPGTAFVAVHAVWLGAQLDGSLSAWSRESGQIAVQPARTNYAKTYVARLRDGPALIGLQGTALTVAWHARLVGLLGLGLLLALMADVGVAPWRRRSVVIALAVGSLWGPYSTMLFSHVTAGTALLGLWLALRRDVTAQSLQDPLTPVARWRGLWLPLVGGAGGALAVAADYLLVLSVVPMVLLLASPRRWPLWLLGAAPIAALVAWYHHAAFGSAWAVGYDFQQNFAFARGRSSTFDRSPLSGLWVLFGAGHGAGLLVQSPVWLLGVVGLLHRDTWRIGVALLPWILALSMHHTPWGGGTRDYRYLLPALPALAVGVAMGWRRLETWVPRQQRVVAAIGFALVAWSTLQVWTRFLHWRG